MRRSGPGRLVRVVEGGAAGWAGCAGWAGACGKVSMASRVTTKPANSVEKSFMTVDLSEKRERQEEEDFAGGGKWLKRGSNWELQIGNLKFEIEGRGSTADGTD